jgi:lysophospholipase L1-like esterase
MSRKLIPVAAACALACALPASALANGQGRPYYLALGDSLAVGVQPNAAGTSVPTDQGYSNDLYAAEKRRIPGLKLMQLGCPGESTSSMIHGGPFCKYSGSQLSKAVKFIHSHRIAFITLDIGANDVDGCATSSGINFTCVGNGVASIEANVPTIVRKLRKAAGRKAKIAGMTYYDPFLAQYLMGSSGQTIAAASVALAQKINGDLTTDFRSGNFKVADVARAFDTYTPFSDTTTYSGQTVPVAVANICQLTWMCAPAPRGPNVHANASGYREISTVFKKTVG